MRPSSSCHRCAAVLLAVAIASGCATSPPLARVEPVTIHARGDSAEIDAFASSINAALADIAGRLELSIPARGLEVYIFDSAWGMRSYLREHCPEQSGKAAACYSRPGGFVITVVNSSPPGRTDRMLRHELTHFILASHYQDLPRWVDEGLAQFLEVKSAHPRADKRKDFRERRVTPTETAVVQLLSLPANQPLDSRQYLLSWGLVSFLMQDEHLGLGCIKSFLARVGADGQARSHFESTFGAVAQLSPRLQSFLIASVDDEKRAASAPR